MTGRLPAAVDHALAAIAAGRGREPTAAHPDCTCLASYRERTAEDLATGAGADVKSCPVHGKGKS